MYTSMWFSFPVAAMAAVGTLLIVSPAAAQAPAPAPLQLADVLRIALKENPRIRQIEARVERVEGQVQRTLAPFQRPTLTFNGTYSRLSASNAQGGGGANNAAAIQNPFTVGLNGSTPGTQTVTLTNSTNTSGGSTTTTNTASTSGSTRSRQTGGTGGTDGNGDAAPAAPDFSAFGFTTALDQYSTSISLVQRLDVTGLGRAYRSVSNTERSLIRQEREQTRQEIVFNVTTAYYSALRAQALIRVSEASVKQSEEQLRIAQVQFDNGAYAKSDVLRARAQLANNQQTLISARNQAVISRNALANQMGVDPSAPLTLALDETASLPDLPAFDTSQLLNDALNKRPEAVRARLNQDKAKTNTRIARQGQELSMTASLNGNYNGSEGIPSDRRANGSFNLSFSFPLSDGGVTAGNVRSARADERIAAAQWEEYKNGITAEVEQAVVAVRDAHDRAQSAVPALEEAREGYRLSEARLKVGAGTQLALYDAQAALIQAEVNAINARYDYLSAIARLARSTGAAAP